MNGLASWPSMRQNRDKRKMMAKRIGDFLVEISAMTQVQVEEILGIQKAGDLRMFGEIAIDKGYIDDAALKAYIDRPSD